MIGSPYLTSEVLKLIGSVPTLETVEWKFIFYKAWIRLAECDVAMHIWFLFLSGAVALSPFTGNDSLQTTIELPPIQFDFPVGSGADVSRASAVKSVIERTWNLYAEKAFGSDQIQPVNGSGITTRHPLVHWVSRANFQGMGGGR
jgi:hypothetical protein